MVVPRVCSDSHCTASVLYPLADQTSRRSSSYRCKHFFALCVQRYCNIWCFSFQGKRSSLARELPAIIERQATRNCRTRPYRQCFACMTPNKHCRCAPPGGDVCLGCGIPRNQMGVSGPCSLNSPSVVVHSTNPGYAPGWPLPHVARPSPGRYLERCRSALAASSAL